MAYIELSNLTIENYEPRSFTLLNYNGETQKIVTAINALIDNINYIKTTVQSWHYSTEEPTLEEVGIHEIWLDAD